MSALDSRVLSEVRELVMLLQDRRPLSEDARKALNEPYVRRAVGTMLTTGATYGEVTGAPGMPKGLLNVRDEAERRAFLRAIDNDLSEQVKLVREGVSHYFTNGEAPPPYYAWRVAVILRRGKEYALEADFLDGFAKHFRHGIGGRYAELAERAVKARRLTSRSAVGRQHGTIGD